jgi:tellurite resistance protein
MLLSDDLKQLYAQALISIARAEGNIDAEEGERLAERVDHRSDLSLEDLLLERSLSPEDLAVAVRGAPFRGVSVRADEVARTLIEDALYVALAKGHVTAEEGDRMWRYATALGLPAEEFRQLTARWLP